MNRSTLVRRVTLSGIVAAGLVALGATSAAAHVTITPSTTAAGETSVLRVEIPHGCDGSATTAVTIRMPEDVADVTATGTDRWAVDQTADALTWTTDEPLPDGEHAEVEFSVRLPDDAGATLVFPVIQGCEQGEAAWTEVGEHPGEHGEDDDSLDRPAPVVVVTAGEAGATSPDPTTAGPADEEAEPAAATEAASDTAATEAASDTAATEGRDPLVAYGAAGVLAAGVLVGGAFLLRRRRRP